MATEHIRHWQIGDVQVTRIVEINAHEDPFTMLSAETEPDLGKHYPWLAPHFVTEDGQMKISFQAEIKCNRVPSGCSKFDFKMQAMV